MSASIVDPFDVKNDPQMPFLAGALDPQQAQLRLEQAIHAQPGAPDRIRLRAIRVTRHRPGRRCVIEYDVEAEPQEGTPVRHILLGKVRAKGLDRAGYRLAESLREAGFDPTSEDDIAVPRPLGMIPEFQMWLQEKVPGTEATDLFTGPNGIQLATRIAEASHKLHCADIPPRRRHTMADELAILHERLPAVAQMQPQWATSLARILEACDRLGGSVPAPAFRGIHRDFYADHVILDGSVLYLIDFDLYCEGDPALDIGNFMGHLTEQAMRTLGDPEVLMDREEALQERFLELSGVHHRPAIRAYALLTLVRHIWISTRLPERRPFTECVLELCRQRLDIG